MLSVEDLARVYLESDPALFYRSWGEWILRSTCRPGMTSFRFDRFPGLMEASSVGEALRCLERNPDPLILEAMGNPNREMDPGARPCEDISADPSALDPGIRDRVLAFIEAGFRTTDSGDGISKGNVEEALPFPHLYFTCEAGDIISLSDRAIELAGEGASVEPSLYKRDGKWEGLVLVRWPQ